MANNGIRIGDVAVDNTAEELVVVKTVAGLGKRFRRMTVSAFALIVAGLIPQPFATAASLAALKAVDTNTQQQARLTDPLRWGNWQWTLGDFTARVAADPLGGMVVKADAIAASVGAWVRKDVVVANPDWWAVAKNGIGNSTAALQAMFDALKAHGFEGAVDAGGAKWVLSATVTHSIDRLRVVNFKTKANLGAGGKAFRVVATDLVLTRTTPAAAMPAGTGSVQVTDVSQCRDTDLYFITSTDFITLPVYAAYKGQQVKARFIDNATNTIIFEEKTRLSFTSGIVITRARPVVEPHFQGYIEGNSGSEGGIEFYRCINETSDIRARHMGWYGVWARGCRYGRHIGDCGNPYITYDNGLNYGFAATDMCVGTKDEWTGSNVRHVAAHCGTLGTDLDLVSIARGNGPADSVCDFHPDGLNCFAQVFCGADRDQGQQNNQSAALTVQCGGLVKFDVICDAFSYVGIILQPLQNSDDSFIGSFINRTSGSTTGVNGVKVDCQKPGGVIKELFIDGLCEMTAPGSIALFIDTNNSYDGFGIEHVKITGKWSGAAVGTTLTARLLTLPTRTHYILFAENYCTAIGVTNGNRGHTAGGGGNIFDLRYYGAVAGAASNTSARGYEIEAGVTARAIGSTHLGIIAGLDFIGAGWAAATAHRRTNP